MTAPGKCGKKLGIGTKSLEIFKPTVGFRTYIAGCAAESNPGIVHTESVCTLTHLGLFIVSDSSRWTGCNNE
jgi:hypothetical protein